MSRVTARLGAALGVALFFLYAAEPASAFPIHGNQGVLPAGTELNEDALDQPTELFHSEVSGGRKSYLVNLGDMAFSSPGLFGGPAKRAGLSCASCHVNGASNAKLYIPGMSTHAGNFDTTGSFFNPRADDGVLDPLTIPSLRGARYLAPYGHDGRIASLREFIRNVIVNEFAGPEPSTAIVDAMVTYIQDIDFLPNPLVGTGGKLTGKASDAARRGEVLFNKPFASDPTLACTSCHIPSAAFVDHRQHDVGTGGLFKTPTLLNAKFNAPYFHDGRFSDFDEVVAYFDKAFALGLSAEDRQDLVAYLFAIGDGVAPVTPDGVDPRLKEIRDFSSVLATAIPAQDKDVIALAADTIGGELREFTEHFPDRFDTSATGGAKERAQARALLKGLVLSLRRIAMSAGADDFAAANSEYASYHQQLDSGQAVLKAAEPWSLFDPTVHDRHYATLQQLVSGGAAAVGTAANP
ncbi:MAG TPA: cytochrome c peroxidase, partial [Stellaceae bacterium]|nr:cytochrome c peroxidase [Stellaceae bacterium]